MAYYTKVLQPDEQVRFVGRLHWAIYLKAWLCLSFAAGAGAAFVWLKGSAADSATSATAIGAGAIGAVLLAFGLVLWLAARLRRNTTEIVVTDRRVIFKEGLVRRRTMEMNMNKIETVDVVQTVFGRIFDYGTILIRGTGSSYEPLHLIDDPLALRTAIIAQ